MATSTDSPRTAGSTRRASATRRRAARGGSPLVIVESPAKAKTIAGYLGPGYVVESSIGHIRDLPRNAADIPAKYKGESWARLGVDVDNGFEPLYVISPDRKQQVARLKTLLKDASELYLATDEDREGEAIAWHLLEMLKPRVPVRGWCSTRSPRRRSQDAVANPRDLDRRWSTPRRPAGSSTGSTATRSARCCGRRSCRGCRPAGCSRWPPAWSSSASGSGCVSSPPSTGTSPGSSTPAGRPPTPSPRRSPRPWSALDGRRVATGRDFDPETGAVRTDALALDEAVPRGAGRDARRHAVHGAAGSRRSPTRRRPYPPFITSTLQQESRPQAAVPGAAHDADGAAAVRERLHHLHAYRLDEPVRDGAHRGPDPGPRAVRRASTCPPEPRSYAPKVKNAQEAHEAIRPAGDTFRTPGEVAGELSADEYRLYELIWQRTVASQMADARGQTLTVRIAGTAVERARTSSSPPPARTITFPGFLRAYVEQTDEGAERDDAERRLPPRPRATRLTARELEPNGHTTTPPARYTEASLVKALEELGIGRPSTYATILQTSRTAATSGRRAPRWCPPGWRSRSSACWSPTSAASSTTTSPRRWRTTSTRSRPATRTAASTG